MSAPEPQPKRIVEGALTIEVGPQLETCVVRLAGELDAGNAPALDRELRRLLAAELETVLLDLDRLAFIDSTGISTLLEATRRSRSRGDQLRIVGARDQVEQVLRLTGIRDVLPIIDR